MAASTPPTSFPVDALLPADIARKAESVGMGKAWLDTFSTFALAVLAGAFIALGAVFATTVTAGAAGLPYGIVRLLGGVVFCLGLVLVVLAGAELFTGNNLIVMAWASRSITTGRLLRNWGIVYVGNFVGALATAVFVFLGRQYSFGGGAVGQQALAIADAKLQLGFGQAFMLGILCNALVCLAVWLCMGAHSTSDRILAILFPIAAFVAAGFEHSVANMYFVPIALLIQSFAEPEFWASIGSSPEAWSELGWGRFLWANLLPVTLGNIVGGAGLVGLVYWAIYLRRGQDAESEA